MTVCLRLTLLEADVPEMKLLPCARIPAAWKEVEGMPPSFTSSSRPCTLAVPGASGSTWSERATFSDAESWSIEFVYGEETRETRDRWVLLLLLIYGSIE